MNDALSGRQPLNVARAEAGRGSQRIRMIDESVPHDRDRLKPAMGVLRKSRHDTAVIHPPAVLALEVLSDISSCERCRGSELFVAPGISVVVVHAEQKRIRCLPWHAQRPHAQNNIHTNLALRKIENKKFSARGSGSGEV